MPTISHITRTLIEKRPFLEESLAEGIVNHSALAESLIPQIEKELNKKIKFSAVNLAIRRMSENAKRKKIINLKFNENTDITVKSRIIEIVLHKLSLVEDFIKKVYKVIDFKKGDFMTVTYGINEIMIITNEKYEQEINKIIPSKHIKNKIKGICALTINLPESCVTETGLFYLISRSLNWENINIIDIVSTYTEITILVDQIDSGKSLEILNSLIDDYK